MRSATHCPRRRRQARCAGERRWALNDRVRHRFFGEGLVVGFIDQDILDIDFGGTAPVDQARGGAAGVASLSGRCDNALGMPHWIVSFR